MKDQWQDDIRQEAIKQLAPITHETKLRVAHITPRPTMNKLKEGILEKGRHRFAPFRGKNKAKMTIH